MDIIKEVSKVSNKELPGDLRVSRRGTHEVFIIILLDKWELRETTELRLLFGQSEVSCESKKKIGTVIYAGIAFLESFRRSL